MKDDKYERRDITRAFAEAAIKQHGGIMAASRALAPHCTSDRAPVVGYATVQNWLAQSMMAKDGPAIAKPIDPEIVNRIAKLITESGVPIDAIAAIDHVKFKSWGVSAKQKNADGTTEIITKDLHSTGIVLLPKEKYEPKWPLVQPAAPTIITYKDREARPWLVQTKIVLPDVQVGWLRDFQQETFSRDGVISGKAWPTHDPDAIDVALQIIADLQPEGLGWVGDFFDLNEMSRWLQHEEFWRTTQPALDTGETILASAEAAAGPPSHREPTFWIDGNHDRRFQEYMLKNARAAFGLRPANTTPLDWPAHSLPSMLHFDKLGIEVCGVYPGSEKWLKEGRNGLVVRHDPLGRKDAYEASVIAGHTHKSLKTPYTRRSSWGMQTYWNYQIGCLCRIDDIDMPRSLMRTPVPSDRGHIDGWVQSLAVVTFDGDNFDVEQPSFYRGADGSCRATFRGRIYSSLGATFGKAA